ncbi:MAG: Fe-S osidoreductase [Rhodospirillaceae bacterium BRH_c57]|nr:MAG: Fe-S osidoreductase [Rhodospirillaceae bacterium BRH_c57]
MGKDLVLVNPGGRVGVYQSLGNDLTAIEPPLWCRLIAGYARDRGYDVTIIDSEGENLCPESVTHRIRALEPTLVVIVVFGHQPSASTQMMVGAGDVCRAIKALTPEQPLLIVGGHVSALPERSLREEAVDFVCKGEGPVTVVQLLEALRGRKRNGELDEEAPGLEAVQGLVWRNGGEIVCNPVAPLIGDLDADLHGQVWDMLPMDRYRAHNWQCFGALHTRMPYASIYTSLGCPYKCSFCCIHAPFDSNRYRMRKPEAVVAEIDHLYRAYGVRTFKIVDEMFVLNERHVAAICEGIIGLGYSAELNIWAYSRIDTVKPRMLEMLRKAGIRWLALGIESGSKHVRDGSDKHLRYDDIIAIVRQIQQADISVIGNFIFGLPDDTMETMRETLDLAKELNCEFANFYSAMAYPGSALYQKAVDQGWALPEAWSGFSQHSHDCQPLPTETLPAAQILGFRDAAFHEYFATPRYLEMVTQRFGWETRRHIEEMAAHRLRRKFLEGAAQ